jgi:hypothetical protein
MPSVTITNIRYEGTEQEVLRFMAQNGHTVAAASSVAPAATGHTNGVWDQVAGKFETLLKKTAAAGRPSQRKAMLAWLKEGGSIELTKLWNAAGVKTQHDYAGVGGSLSKNMIKAGGPKDWYDGHVDKAGEWHYTILPELVEPLKRAFGV